MAHGQPHSVLRYIRRLAGAHGDGLTDGQLLERFRTERDEAAFEVLVWRHGPMVFGLCRRLLQNVQAAEDALQATFLTLVRKADSVNQRNSIGSWLYKVAYRIALRARAEAVQRAAHEKQVPELPPIQAPGEAGGMIADWELRALLDEELNRLPERYRVPVVLCWLEGKTHEEAARELGWAKGTVATRLLRAREMLRRRLASRGLTLSAGAFATVLAEQTTSAAVPAVLVAATRKAALACAAGETARAVSSQVITYTEGALRTMSITKLKSVAAGALIVGMLGTGAGVAYHRTLFGAPPEASHAQLPRGLAEEKTPDGGPARWQQRVALRGHIGSESDKPKDEAKGTTEGKDKPLTRRENRQLRWVLVFNTKDGNDYAKQLQALGAILAAPESGSSYRLFRDLTKRPVKGQVEDLKNINRIYWIDDAKKSVESLSKALGLQPAPAHIVALFPEKLEKELLQKELTFAGRKEEDIEETQFKVVQKDERYEVLVTNQKARKSK